MGIISGFQSDFFKTKTMGFPNPIFRQLGVGFLMSGGQGRDKAGEHLQHQGGDAMLLIQWLKVNGYGY